MNSLALEFSDKSIGKRSLKFIFHETQNAIAYAGSGYAKSAFFTKITSSIENL
ncbi:hypothetical protein [Nostoc sp. C117]|uniref:hypothetical protein n=1 Tax=Nostoc sp. C117 TaxID=3349875 RepID=UPI00370D89D4